MHAIYTGRAIATLGAAATIFIGACGSKDSQQTAAAPAREIQLAPASNAQPQLNDVPAKQDSAPAPAPAPKRTTPPKKTVAKAPAPVTPPPEPQVIVTAINPAPPSATSGAAANTSAPMGTIDPGTRLTVHPTSRVCTTQNRVGDRFSATLAEDVRGSNGATIPAGSNVLMRVTQSARSQNTKDSVKLAFDVESIQVGTDTYAIDGRVVTSTPLEKVRAQSTGDQAKKIGAGAAIGAIVGQLFGHNTKSTVVGGVVGAAGGAAVASATADYDGCVPTTGSLTITLTHPLRIKLATH